MRLVDGSGVCTSSRLLSTPKQILSSYFCCCCCCYFSVFNGTKLYLLFVRFIGLLLLFIVDSAFNINILFLWNRTRIKKKNRNSFSYHNAWERSNSGKRFERVVDEERKKKRWAVFNVEKVLQYKNQKAQRIVQKI